MVAVHRWVVAQVDGWAAVEDKIVMHRCDNPPCFRYDHLVVGTLSDNTQDMISKGRQKPGFSKGNRRMRTKINQDQADAIRVEYGGGGVRQVDLAEKYGISQRMVSAIVRGDSW